MHSFINNLFQALIFPPLFFSCNSDTIAGKPPVKHAAYRVLDAAEVSNYNASLSIFFDSLLLRSGFSGGILVAKNGQVLYEHYQGYSDAYKADSITDATPFHVASTSKTFTSTAIMQLVEAGKVKLDDSLETYFPAFPYPGITVRNLLSHSSGIPYYANFFEKYKWDRKKVATNADVLYMLYANRPPLEFTTGSRFRYCNTNFVLLALIVEKASGRFFPDYVKDSIFTRCGMSNSYIVSQHTPEKFLPSWTPGNRIYQFDYLDGIYGDKNVFTTCRDMLKYDSSIRENLLLHQSSYEQVWTPYFKDSHYHDTSEYYGLGWRLKIFPDSLKIPYHNGWWHGNNSVFQRVIADTAVIIVTGNHFATRIYQSAKAANVFRPYYTMPIVDDESPADIQEPISAVKRKSVVSSGRRSAVKKKPSVSRKRKR
ncbi:serine hydrolase domain-containing protein [soil metagenome]